MRCESGTHYVVIRHSTARWWQEPNDHGPIKALKCKFCHFEVLKRYTGKPKSSKSGLGRYNRMRGQMVKHLHEKHREALTETLGQEVGDAAR